MVRPLFMSLSILLTPGAYANSTDNSLPGDLMVQGVISGDGSGITNQSVVVTTTSLANQIDIAHTFYVGVATVTATLRGNRPVMYLWVVSFDDQSSGNRTYTCQMSENGAPLTASTRQTDISNTFEFSSMGGHTILPKSTKGVMNLSLNCKTNNATGSQYAASPHLSILEF